MSYHTLFWQGAVAPNRNPPIWEWLSPFQRPQPAVAPFLPRHRPAEPPWSVLRPWHAGRCSEGGWSAPPWEVGLEGGCRVMHEWVLSNTYSKYMYIYMHIYIPTYIYISLYDSMILYVCVKTDISIKFCKYFPMKDTAKPLKASVVPTPWLSIFTHGFTLQKCFLFMSGSPEASLEKKWWGKWWTIRRDCQWWENL